MTRKAFLLSLAAVAAFVLGAGTAQAKPNLSGSWKLNVEKSTFGPFPAPDKYDVKIAHEEPNLNVHTAQSGAQGDMEFDMKYTTDGKESKNTLNTPGGPMDSKSTAVWEGDVLVINTKLDINGQEITLKGKWSLSSDGKTLTNNTSMSTPQGDLDLTYVLVKQ